MGFNIEKIAIRRGKLYGAIVDGVVHVNHGSAKGYPDGDSILWKLHESNIEDMIALLKAIKHHKPNQR
ncbi:MAG: hypothetical protein [Bacteriophage sp.]|nr:MAG: hypothetical protein [Bacteriophage sp.]